jgi:hypothetical protein
MHDWGADIRARLAPARLHPQDEAEMVEEVAQPSVPPAAT